MLRFQIFHKSFMLQPPGQTLKGQTLKLKGCSLKNFKKFFKPQPLGQIPKTHPKLKATVSRILKIFQPQPSDQILKKESYGLNNFRNSSSPNSLAKPPKDFQNRALTIENFKNLSHSSSQTKASKWQAPERFLNFCDGFQRSSKMKGCGLKNVNNFSGRGNQARNSNFNGGLQLKE